MFLGGRCLHRSFFFATMNYAFWTYDDDLESLAGPLTFYIHLPRPGLVKLLVSPTFRHLYIVTRVSQDFTASVVYHFVIFCHRCFLLPDRMRLLSPVSRTPWSLRRFLYPLP